MSNDHSDGRGMNRFANYQKVRLLTHRFLDEGVSVGAEGYIIEVYRDNHYEVEFSDPQTGITIAQVVATASELEAIEEHSNP